MKKRKFLRIEELNWKKIEDLDKEKTLVVIPISPLEAHGPHLPVGTDILVTEEICKEMIARLKKKRRGLSIILYPTLTIGYCGVNDDLPGSVSVDAKAFEKIIHDTLKALANHGFRYIMILTFHADPFYVKAIHNAIKKVRNAKHVEIAEPLSKIFYRNRGEEFLHSGKEETSIMLYLYPYLVDKTYKSLKEVRLAHSLRNLRKTLREIGAVDGYTGDPSNANMELGKRLFDQMVDSCVEVALKLLDGKYEECLPAPLRYLPLSLRRRI